jgi:uracil-DNA glycosylase
MSSLNGLSLTQRDAWRSLELGPEPRIASGASETFTHSETSGGSVGVANMSWNALEQQITSCSSCALSSTRRQALIGLGSQKAPWLLIGDAPDENEDIAGEPFCGPSGQLLEAIFHAVGLQRERDVFLTNIVRCRPPTGRDPAAAEISACAPFWRRQAELISPSKIILLGRIAAQAVLGDHASTASLRGRIHHIVINDRNVPVIATYHPSYLMRNPEHKNRAWQDWLLAKSI